MHAAQGMECREDELCGCGSLDMTYSECRLPSDRQRSLLLDALFFLREVPETERAQRGDSSVAAETIRTAADSRVVLG